jgi:SAM-dependent methyltransferase
MIKQFFHDTMDGKVSSAWGKRSAVKILESPRLVVCMPVGSKMQYDLPLTDEGQAREDKISAGIRIPAVIPVQLLTCMQQLTYPLNSSVVHMTQYGQYSGEARQVLTMNALRNVQEDGYILFWDDDCLPPPLGLYTMWNYMEQHQDVGILSAVYCTRETPAEPVMYKYPTCGVAWDFTMGPTAMPEEIFSAGAGFMLARVSAVRAAIAKNPGEPVWADMKTEREYPGEPAHPLWGNGIMWGHDVRFCRLIADAGYKVMIDGRVECGHLDITSQQVHYLPDDCPPKQRGQQFRGEAYWNQLYGNKGIRRIHQDGKLLEAVLGRLNEHSHVFEVGCGNGIFGSLVTAQGGCKWTGIDQSQVAVDMCNARFLNAHKAAVTELTADNLAAADVVVAIDVLEHLIDEDRDHLLAIVREAGKRLVYTEGGEIREITNEVDSTDPADVRPVLVCSEGREELPAEHAEPRPKRVRRGRRKSGNDTKQADGLAARK